MIWTNIPRRSAGRLSSVCPVRSGPAWRPRLPRRFQGQRHLPGQLPPRPLQDCGADPGPAARRLHGLRPGPPLPRRQEGVALHRLQQAHHQGRPQRPRGLSRLLHAWTRPSPAQEPPSPLAVASSPRHVRLSRRGARRPSLLHPGQHHLHQPGCRSHRPPGLLCRLCRTALTSRMVSQRPRGTTTQPWRC